MAPENQVLFALGVDPESPPSPAGVRWFHATRAVQGSSFSEGLLPTDEAMPRLWDALGATASQWMATSDWNEYRRSFMRGDRLYSKQYAQKRIVPGWAGPFAFLVRDAALNRHRGHKDFTGLSEAAEDICADFNQVYGLDLKSAYQASTGRCLVVFTTRGAYWGTVRAAANYVYYATHGLECGHDCNTNFSGKGQAVPPDVIDRVEWL